MAHAAKQLLLGLETVRGNWEHIERQRLGSLLLKGLFGKSSYGSYVRVGVTLTLTVDPHVDLCRLTWVK